MRVKMLGIVCGVVFASSLTANAETSAYTGMEHADIKALSADEQATLLDGKGMGFARAAELNGYPGPAHVLALGTELGLTAGQLARTRELFARMQSVARSLGARLIEEERTLDRLYASRAATVAKVNRQLARIEGTRARLRGVHLNAHLEQAALLNGAQIARYSGLRGYSAPHAGH
jgi:hypothetical protein